jgi:hypothetical protein
MAAFTAIMSSSVATYCSVPVKRCSLIRDESNRERLNAGEIAG